jgi:DNA-binding FadR family transcriptional regulator
VAIEDALAAMADSSPDHADAHAEADFAFHAAVIGASGNPIFAQFLGLVRAALLESFRRTLPSSEAHARSLLMHQTVFDAIRARDAAAARSATIALLDDARRLLSAASGGTA